MSDKQRKPGRYRKRMGVMDKALLFVAVTLVLFTIAMIIIYVRYLSIPDTLCTCVFAALSGECGVLGIIKSIKLKSAVITADTKEDNICG